MAKIDSILVVGGGVAGLTAAAALSRNDLPVELVERRDTWWAPGLASWSMQMACAC